MVKGQRMTLHPYEAYCIKKLRETTDIHLYYKCKKLSEISQNLLLNRIDLMGHMKDSSRRFYFDSYVSLGKDNRRNMRQIYENDPVVSKLSVLHGEIMKEYDEYLDKIKDDKEKMVEKQKYNVRFMWYDLPTNPFDQICVRNMDEKTYMDLLNTSADSLKLRYAKILGFDFMFSSG